MTDSLLVDLHKYIPVGDAKPFVYMAGPITKPEPIGNARVAVSEYVQLLRDGFVTPFCPHLSVLVPIMLGGAVDDYALWLGHDFEIIQLADALYRMPGESYGADLEERWASALGLPVFSSRADLYNWASSR